jgi:hypothetical protein
MAELQDKDKQLPEEPLNKDEMPEDALEDATGGIRCRRPRRGTRKEQDKV